MSDLRRDIASVLNRHSAENGSDTPDFILAQFVEQALAAFDAAVTARANWYGHESLAERLAVPGLTADV